MILKSFSKINLSLTVNRRLKNSGLHEIQSYFCLINLFDQIKIKKIKGQKDIVKSQGKFAQYIKKKNPLIFLVILKKLIVIKILNQTFMKIIILLDILNYQMKILNNSQIILDY